jgi:pyruvate formate lyase activating enzyme
MAWKRFDTPASHWISLNTDRKVQCRLCPRGCVTAPGQDGFCGVRGNIEGEFHAYSYGKSIAPAIESIESEAVFHYNPGAKILSMGNVGCMMSCSFCQNWETSQVQHLDASNVSTFTPEDIVALAKRNNIDIISWTYNDPVVWHEFVVETSRLAQSEGLKTLYKTALYINHKPLEELLDCIDIFSVSFKSMSDAFYRKVTKGSLGPVLEAIETIHATDRHLEISQLLVTEMNDKLDDVERTVRWVVDRLGTKVPLHFVRFHPAYKYLDVERTPVAALTDAKDMALRYGIEHCYIGNLFDNEVSNTYCKSCNALLVKRLGLSVSVESLDAAGRCTHCTTLSSITNPCWNRDNVGQEFSTIEGKFSKQMDWTSEISNAHVILPPGHSGETSLRVVRQPSGSVSHHSVGGGLDRFIISKEEIDEVSINVQWDVDSGLFILPVLDRAHYPVM